MAESTQGRHGRTASPTERLDRALFALAHPARRAMLARLAGGRASATELKTLVDISQPAVSKHLKVLEEAGLISRGRDAQWRPCELRVDVLEEVESWLQDFHRSWEDRLDRLERHIRRSREEAQGAATRGAGR